MKKIDRCKALHFIGKGLLVYIAYAFITGVLFFAIPVPNDTGYSEIVNPDRFYAEEQGPDHVVLLEDSYLAGLARINIIENAQETIDVAYYTIWRDTTAKVFFGALIEAADRGVKVRVLLDGIFHNLTGDLQDMRYAMLVHENIELKFYEPLNLLMPWTFNNRLHDKYIVVDEDIAMIGGRNIGDRYFFAEPENMVSDRDVLILNEKQNGGEQESVVFDMNDYFEAQWEHKYSKYPRRQVNERAMDKAEAARVESDRFMELARAKNPQYFDSNIDWLSMAVPTRKISFIHNPMDRMSKEPWVLMEIAALMEKANESIFIQSPYVVPTRAMLRYLPLENLEASSIILTNSPASNPNVFATAGYLNNKGNVKKFADMLFEYSGNGSLHAKTYVIDERISVVGSYNVDARSTFLSTESMVVIDSPEFASVLKEEVLDLIEKSSTPKELSFGKKVLLGVTRVLVYFFGFML
ncbi:putative cardiolipin synthase [Desulfitispora alkaliphila]|uniref:phospholipase D-like domain-containing protein n=1 Tax=Desulfitispora alkaliphila TaxID=622674 RepID=UPI003D21B477